MWWVVVWGLYRADVRTVGLGLVEGALLGWLQKVVTALRASGDKPPRFADMKAAIRRAG